MPLTNVHLHVSLGSAPAPADCCPCLCVERPSGWMHQMCYLRSCLWTSALFPIFECYMTKAVKSIVRKCLWKNAFTAPGRCLGEGPQSQRVGVSFTLLEMPNRFQICWCRCHIRGRLSVHSRANTWHLRSLRF